MEALPEWLTDWSTVGGTIVAILALFLTYYIYRRTQADKPDMREEADSGDGNAAVGNSAPTAQASNGGQAANRDAIQNNYHGASTAEVVDLAKRLGVTEGAVNSFLRRIGEAEVPPERIPATLDAMAERYKALHEELETLRSQTPEVAQPEITQAELAIEAGDFDEARRLLAQIGEAYDRAAAATWARRGDIDMIDLRYRDAAKAYQNAAGRIPAEDREIWRQHTRAAGWALRQQGLEFGDNAALEEALSIFTGIADRFPRTEAPDHWADAQNLIGVSANNLGERESGTERLEQAVAAYRAALEERKRTRVPLDWATTQNNLGNALLALGERENGTVRLEQAITAFQSALEEYTQARVPLRWATAKSNLGEALRILGEREPGTKRLEQAVTAFRTALEERTQTRVPLDWAKTQSNLGSALLALGEREPGTERLKQAVTAFRAALEERTRTRGPLDWAETQHRLGNALLALGKRESSPERLERAVSAYRNALEERTQARVPVDWAMTKNNLGNAKVHLAQRNKEVVLLDEALAHYGGAAEVFAFSAPYFAEVLEQNKAWLQSVRDELLDKQAAEKN